MLAALVVFGVGAIATPSEAMAQSKGRVPDECLDERGLIDNQCVHRENDADGNSVELYSPDSVIAFCNQYLDDPDAFLVYYWNFEGGLFRFVASTLDSLAPATLGECLFLLPGSALLGAIPFFP